MSPVSHYVLTFVLLCSLGQATTAQTVHQYLRQGTDAYAEAAYTDAEEAFRRALEVRPNLKSNYNLGNAIYQQERYKEAIKHYEAAAENTPNARQRADAYYNLGNAYLKTQDPQKAAEAFQEALKLRPSDADAKHNLVMAKRLLRQQQQQQQQNQQQQQQNQQGQQNQQQGKDAGGDSTGEEGQGTGDDSPKGQGAASGKSLSRREAEQVLRVMENEERRVQEAIRRTKGSKRDSGKDW